ncbi:hypothetical protein Ahy_A04g020542 [Arachis hypogaea]|uniref:Uncharacterized protein n=1 Tax=Arachis hypogaea TaxID=3818 RepID=A0A445DI05_ARAHY|nr:hypothetical protein Ahy_A04g020542 [Arachis hypogaea]
MDKKIRIELVDDIRAMVSDNANSKKLGLPVLSLLPPGKLKAAENTPVAMSVETTMQDSAVLFIHDSPLFRRSPCSLVNSSPGLSPALFLISMHIGGFGSTMQQIVAFIIKESDYEIFDWTHFMYEIEDTCMAMQNGNVNYTPSHSVQFPNQIRKWRRCLRLLRLRQPQIYLWTKGTDTLPLHSFLEEQPCEEESTLLRPWFAATTYSLPTVSGRSPHSPPPQQSRTPCSLCCLVTPNHEISIASQAPSQREHDSPQPQCGAWLPTLWLWRLLEAPGLDPRFSWLLSNHLVLTWRSEIDKVWPAKISRDSPVKLFLSMDTGFIHHLMIPTRILLLSSSEYSITVISTLEMSVSESTNKP